MEKKTVSGIMLTLMLTSMLTLALNSRPAKASGTIYIRADGSVDPSTAPIHRDGDTYTFTADIYDSIVVERDNIIIDGNGYMIQGVIDHGFLLSERSNVTIKNTKITGFSFGITLYSSFNNTIINNTFVSNQWFGISISGGSIINPSSNNTIINNSVSESACGIQVHGGGEYYNTIENNKIYSNIVGIQFSENARYNVILGNSLSNNDYGFMIMGRPEEQENSGNRIFHNNFVENTHQAVDNGADNTWDDGYPSGGNYWSDYSGVDLYHGANQDVPSRDGIGDTHYIIDPNKQDRYPLMDPWIERRVGVQVGDWVKYGNFVVEWSSDDPSANPPSDYDFWRSIEWTKTTVETTSGTTITFEFLIHFKDDTEQSSIWDIDVDTGEGFPFYFISAGLTAGYTTYAGGIGYSPGPKINETILDEYLSTLRETNHLNLTRFYEDYFGWKNYRESYNLFWDKTTGVQTEYSYQRSFETGTETYLTAQLTSFRIVDTDLWGTPPVTSAIVDLDPETLNLKSKGQWITAYIQLPEGYHAADINATTIMLNGTISPVLDPKYDFVTNASEYLVDHNNDGILERMVKFDRTAIESFIYDQGIRYGEIALALTGNLSDGTAFEGTDVIFVNYAGDVNNDGKINILDAAAISAHWYPGPPAGLLGYDLNADLNEDGLINILDSGLVSSNWGQTIP